MNIIEKNVADIKPYKRNPRVNDQAVEAVANSIREFGFKVPLVIDSKGIIVTGHTRYKAAQMLGMEVLPCVIADDLTEEQIKAFRLADNKVGEISEWDDALLELELFDITDIDMSQFGFDLGSEEEDSKKKESEKRFEKMQLRAFEHYDYVVFVFKNQMDWLNILNEFDVKKVDAGYGKTRKIGLGRVIDGARLLEKIGYPNSDLEQGESEDNSNE